MELAHTEVARARTAVAAATRTRLLVYAGAAAFSLVFAAGAVVVYASFHEARLDLGDMTQAVWATAHGHPLRVSSTAGHEFLRLGAHVDPFLVLFAPLWWLWSSPLLLLVVQVPAVAAGALPVYRLGCKHLGSERIAALFALVYLLYPATQYNALTGSGPHPVSFAVPLLLFAIWFLDEDRLVVFAATALLAATTEEQIPLAIGLLGVWYAIARRRRAAGAAILVLGLAGTLVDFLVVLPHYSPTGADLFNSRYAAVGGSPGGMARTLVTDPLAYVHAVSSLHKLLFLAVLVLPLLGLSLLEPLLLLGAVPSLAVDLLAARPQQTSIHYQDTAGIAPFLVAAAVLGAARIRRERDRERLAAVAVLAAAPFLLHFCPLRFAIADLPQARASDPVHAAKAHALALVPQGAAVSATNALGGYLSERRTVSSFPNVGSARWLVVDSRDETYGPPAAEQRKLAAVEASPRWRLVYQAQGIEVFRRRGG